MKNSPKRLPDLEKEVGGKGQEAAGVRHARTRERTGGLDPEAEMVLPPPSRAGRLRGATGRARRRSAKALRMGPKVLSQPGGPKPPYLTGFLGILDLHGVCLRHQGQPRDRSTEGSWSAAATPEVSGPRGKARRVPPLRPGGAGLGRGGGA